MTTTPITTASESLRSNEATGACALQADGLLPCPFCTSEQVQRIGRPDALPVFVACHACNAQGPYRDTVADAIAAWNTRTPPPQEAPAAPVRADDRCIVCNAPGKWSDDVCLQCKDVIDDDEPDTRRVASGEVTDAMVEDAFAAHFDPDHAAADPTSNRAAMRRAIETALAASPTRAQTINSQPVSSSLTVDSAQAGSAEPVAWQCRHFDREEQAWGEWHDCRTDQLDILRNNGYEVRPLYAAPTPVAAGSRPSTHWDGCWRDSGHHACAVAEIERMLQSLQSIGAVIRTDVPGERKEEEKVSKWQSIDSAPKDGTLFLAFCPDMPAFYDGFWSFRPKGPPGIAVCHWDDYRDPQCGQLEPTGFVLSHIARDSGGSVYVLKPSHWMPLPEPPK